MNFFLLNTIVIYESLSLNYVDCLQLKSLNHLNYQTMICEFFVKSCDKSFRNARLKAPSDDTHSYISSHSCVYIIRHHTHYPPMLTQPSS